MSFPQVTGQKWGCSCVVVDVPRCFWDGLSVDIQQELTDAEREQVAMRLLAEQRERFDGVRKAAYTAAKVNPATWARATAAMRVRPDRLVQIVKALWPESGGRWEMVPKVADATSWSAVPSYVQRGPWTGEVENAMADVDGRFLSLESRVRELERQMVELMIDPDEQQLPAGEGGGADGDAAANQVPAPSPGDQLGTDEPDVVIVRDDGLILGQDPSGQPPRRGRGARD
jgi:hypothetical protein